MGLLNVIGVLAILFAGVVIFGFIVTFPGWAAGWLHWNPDRNPTAGPATESPRRRWMVWAVACWALALSVGGLASGATLVAGPLLAVSFPLAQWAAFNIGFLGRDARHARAHGHAYSPFPDGLGPQHDRD